jgi:ribonuclease P protein component
VLSSSNRLTSPEHFREVVRRGRRRGGQLLVVHLRQAAAPGLHTAGSALPRVGFVVSRAVGPAVTRNLVKRRLRHLARERLASLPAGSMLVVRALPAAAEAGYDELGAELDRCLSHVGATQSHPVKVGISR